MTDQRKAILILVGIVVIVAVIAGVGVSKNSQSGSANSKSFDPDEFPLLKGIGSLLSPFSPKLKKEDLNLTSTPFLFSIQSSEKDFRKMNLCIKSQHVNELTGTVIVEYRALSAEEKFKDLKKQVCTLSVKNSKRFPSCTNITVLKNSGQIFFRHIQGSVSITFNDELLARLP